MDVDRDVDEIEGRIQDGCENEGGGIRIGDIYIPPPPPPSLTFDPTGPRLIISKIVINNFKSYGGTVVLGPFHKNFTSIVGPNGSGKSNVIDSMLFVFGYRAQKIRSQSVGVLIHNSDAHPNVTSCSVDVYFQKIIDKPGNDFDVVPHSEFCISRVAHKDNSSHYCINKSKVPFKEISKLLRSHGIDLDYNRFLILQGEVEQISLMKPKAPNEHETGMLEFLEDIIGSGRLKEPIELLARRVEELNEQRSEKLNRVKVVEKEREQLEGPKEEALEYINAKNQVVVKKHSLTQFYMHELKQKMEESSKRKEAFEKEMNEFMEMYNETETDIKGKLECQEKVANERKKLFKAEEGKQQVFSKLELRDVQKSEELKHAKAAKTELVATLEKERRHLDDLQGVPVKLEREAEELQQRAEELQQQRTEAEKDLNEAMNSLHASTKGLQEEKNKHECSLMNLQKIVDDTNSKMSIAKVELDLYLKNGEGAIKRLEELENRSIELANNMQQLERECFALQSTIPQLEKDLEEQQRELAGASHRESTVLTQLKQHRTKLEEARTALQTSQTRGRLLESLMQEKSSERIPGIIGRLGDLGAIDDKYDVAISTACPRLDNIVTDTLATAEQCVNFLKRNNLGRATFISLDKMDKYGSDAKRKFVVPPGAQRLFDLVTVKDERVLPAFYFSLSDTLVANNIQQATAIGLQGKSRYRVVTIGGEIIELSGAMSGGGDRPIRGKMSTAVVGDLYTPRQIQEMEALVNGLQQQAAEVSRLRVHLQENIETSKKSLTHQKHELEKHRLEMQGFGEQREQLTLLVKDQNAKVLTTTPDEQHVIKLRERVEETKKEFENADKAASKIKAIVTKLHEQIMEFGGSIINPAQKRVQDIKSELDNVTSRINKIKVSLKTTGRNFEKTQKKIAILETEISGNVKKQEELKQFLKDDEEKACQLLLEINTIKGEREKLEKEIDDLKTVVKGLLAEKQTLDTRKVDLDYQFNQLKEAENAYVEQLNIWKKELSKMAIEQVDGCTACQLAILTDDELQTLDVEDYKYKVTILEEKLKKLKPNLNVIAEFKRKDALYLQRVEELDAITQQRDAQRSHHDALRRQRLNEFMSGFQIITYKLKETYQMLTLGGDAELELVNSLDPFSDGIVFSVRPPRKSWKNIANLSGGEKTLSSLSLVFALHYYKPTPFYVMDEIDAALDFRNVAIVGQCIKDQTRNAQFIVISLRNNMFELASRLVGVYKTFNTSHTLNMEYGKSANETEA